jgi:hypothetical protein
MNACFVMDPKYRIGEGSYSSHHKTRRVLCPGWNSLLANNDPAAGLVTVPEPTKKV